MISPTPSSAPVWLELLKALPSVVTATAAVWGLLIARAGLTKWRQETIGKRKAELAEEVLADFYQARDIIRSARSPISREHEGATRQKSASENESDTRTLNSYFAIVERLGQKAEFFAQLNARRYRYLAHFGAVAAAPYDELRKIHNEVFIAVEMLVMTHEDRAEGSLPAERREWKTVIWFHGKDDPIDARLDRLIEGIENVCRPAIQETVT